MRFTEDDLRAVLADRSEAVPTRTDLAAIIETRGKTIRRLRRTPGVLLTAAAVAAALLVPGSLRGSEHKSTASQTVNSTRPFEVDPSQFRQALDSRRWAGAFMDRYARPGDLANASHSVVIGTVTGYQGDHWSLGGRKIVLMAVGVDRIVKGTLTSLALLLDLGFEEDDRTISRYAKTAPSGTRLMLFLGGPGQMINLVFPPENPQALVFEDATATGSKLVGGFTPLRGKPWTTPETLEELAASLDKP